MSFAAGFAVAALLTLHRLLIAVPRSRALIPAAMVSIPQNKPDEMTSTLLQECDEQVLRDVVNHMNNIEWQRFFRQRRDNGLKTALEGSGRPHV